MKLIFENGSKDRHLSILPKLDVPAYQVDEALLREEKAALPEVSETEISRHYSALERTVSLPAFWSSKPIIKIAAMKRERRSSCRTLHTEPTRPVQLCAVMMS